MIIESYEDVIVLSGVLRSNFWETVHTAISLMLKRHPTGVIIDCSGITEVTREGADTFVDIMAFIRDHDARIIVAAVPPTAMDVLKSVPEVRSQLAVAKSVEEARRSLDLLVDPEGSKKKPTGPVRVAQKLIVCLTGQQADPDALELVSEVADTIGAAIHVAYLIQVPRDLPIHAPLPKEEERAVIGLAKAKSYLTGRKVAHAEHIERGRDIASAINSMLETVDASHVVVPLSQDEHELDAQSRLVRTILSKVPVTVIFVRGPKRG